MLRIKKCKGKNGEYYQILAGDMSTDLVKGKSYALMGFSIILTGIKNILINLQGEQYIKHF